MNNLETHQVNFMIIIVGLNELVFFPDPALRLCVAHVSDASPVPNGCLLFPGILDNRSLPGTDHNVQESVLFPDPSQTGLHELCE